jgi:hypothetical protein
MELGIAELMGEMVEHFRDTATLTKVDRLTSMLEVYNKMTTTSQIV